MLRHKTIKSSSGNNLFDCKRSPIRLSSDRVLNSYINSIDGSAILICGDFVYYCYYYGCNYCKTGAGCSISCFKQLNRFTWKSLILSSKFNYGLFESIYLAAYSLRLTFTPMKNSPSRRLKIMHFSAIPSISSQSDISKSSSDSKQNSAPSALPYICLNG